MCGRTAACGRMSRWGWHVNTEQHAAVVLTGVSGKTICTCNGTHHPTELGRYHLIHSCKQSPTVNVDGACNV